MSNAINPNGPDKLKQIHSSTSYQHHEVNKKQSRENSSPERTESQTSYAAMLRDAQDGGVDEAYSIVKRTDSRDTRGYEEDVDHLVTERGKNKRSEAHHQDNSSNFLQELRDNKKLEGGIVSGGVSSIDNENGSSIELKHEQLMLRSSQMKVSEVASHVSLSRFNELVRVLSESHWHRFTEADIGVVEIQLAKEI